MLFLHLADCGWQQVSNLVRFLCFAIWDCATQHRIICDSLSACPHWKLLCRTHTGRRVSLHFCLCWSAKCPFFRAFFTCEPQLWIAVAFFTMAAAFCNWQELRVELSCFVYWIILHIDLFPAAGHFSFRLQWLRQWGIEAALRSAAVLRLHCWWLP